jgi:hypothetical protein
METTSEIEEEPDTKVKTEQQKHNPDNSKDRKEYT